MKSHEVTVLGGDTKLVEFYSIAGYSRRTFRIPGSLAGGCCARHQLRNGIDYVPVASKPRISMSSVKGVLATMLADIYSIAHSSTPDGRISILFKGGCWA